MINHLELAVPLFPLVGVSHPEWPPFPSAAMSCPPSLVYNHCEPGCPRHCEGNVSSCGDHPSEGCFCPPHQVMLEGSCVPEEACTQCAGEDGVRHQVGALASHFPWGCCSLGSVGWSVHQWLAPSDFGSRGQLLRGPLSNREAVWHSGFRVRSWFRSSMSHINCVIKHQSVNNPGGDGKIIFYMVMSTIIKIYNGPCIVLSITYSYLNIFQRSVLQDINSYLWPGVFKAH